MTEHAVVIAGAGPAGMMLAAELALGIALVAGAPTGTALGVYLVALALASLASWQAWRHGAQRP